MVSVSSGQIWGKGLLLQVVLRCDSKKVTKELEMERGLISRAFGTLSKAVKYKSLELASPLSRDSFMFGFIR